MMDDVDDKETLRFIFGEIEEIPKVIDMKVVVTMMVAVAELSERDRQYLARVLNFHWPKARFVPLSLLDEDLEGLGL